MITAMAVAERKNPEEWAKKFAGRKRDEEKTVKIIELLTLGLSVRKVAEEVGVNPSTVQRTQ